MKHYRTVPFNPAISERVASKKGGETVAQQLGEVIARAAAEGWGFESYETVQVTVNPGCLSVFHGPQLVTYGVVVFSREA